MSKIASILTEVLIGISANILLLIAFIFIGLPILLFQLIKWSIILFWRLIRLDPLVKLEFPKWTFEKNQAEVSMFTDNIKNYAKFISARVVDSQVKINESKDKPASKDQDFIKIKATVKTKLSDIPRVELKFACDDFEETEMYGDPEEMDTKEFDDWHYYAKLYDESGKVLLMDLNNELSLWAAISCLRGDGKIVRGKQLWCYIKEYDIWLVKYKLTGSASFGYRKKYKGKTAHKYRFDS